MKFMKEYSPYDKDKILLRSYYIPIFYVITLVWLRYLTFGVNTPFFLSILPIYYSGNLLIFKRII